MIVQKRRLHGFILLEVEGVIKLGESAAFFAETLNRALEEEGDVLADFSKIREMDSTGLGELVSYLGRFRNRQRKLILINPADKIRDLLRVSRLDTLFTTYDSVDAAVAEET